MPASIFKSESAGIPTCKGGAGSELYRGLGAVVVGGLVVSTIFTLILVPVLLSFLMKDEVKHTENNLA